VLKTMLTTIDNPHSPFEDWDAWLSWDMAAGYNTSGLLARIAVVSNDLSDKDFDAALVAAIDEIVRENVSGVHRKVTKEVEES
jgi:hypothetical protein